MTKRLRLSWAGGLPGGGFAGQLDAAARSDATAEAAVRHSLHHPFATILAVNAARRALQSGAAVTADRLGVVATAGPIHMPRAWQFARRMIEAGPELVNPLLFPQIISSGTAATVARSVGARAFAFGLGYDEFAFFEGLARAAQLLRHNHADRVIVVAALAAEDALCDAAARAGLSQPIDVAVAANLSHTDGEIEVVGVVTNARTSEDAAQRLGWTAGDSFSKNDSPAPLLAASAVICAQAFATATAGRFAVALETKRRAAGALFDRS